MRFETVESQYYDYLRSKERSQKTVRGYKSDLHRFRRYCEQVHNAPWFVENTTTADIEEFLTRLKDDFGLQPPSRNRILNSLRSFFKFLTRKEICKSNPTLVVEAIPKQRKERIYLMENEVEQLINTIEDPIIKLVTQTLYFTGLRISECLNLCIRDIVMELGVIHVDGKGHQERTIPINEQLLPKLKEYKDIRKRTTVDINERFFVLEKTGKLSACYYNYCLRKATTKLGWDKCVTAHILRHSFASAVARRNGNLVALQRLLGHSSLEVTSQYTHTFLGDMADAVNSL